MPHANPSNDSRGGPLREIGENLNTAAELFDKLQAQQIQGKVRNVPTVKPGSSNPMPQHVKDNFALKKQLNNPKLTSSQKAKAIERELMNRF